ncbi:hypothetical protein BKA56DRAFT_664765 [Ilyonectria sp. MPI-CAGE-AT-0026]|nr:hypothetical protein BKA56DRAFT_664765 [Ilyonectria sp. MPI-CAGE-AT-0026]
MQGTSLDKMNDGGSDVSNLSEGSTSTDSAKVPTNTENSNSGAGSGGGGTGPSNSDPQYVVFTATSNAMVFLTDQERPEILYTVKENTSLNYLIWEAWDGNKYAPISNATFVSEASVKIDGPFAEVTRDGATLNFTSFHSTRANFTNNAMRLIMNFDVDAENLTGNSSSEFFAVVDTSAAKTEASAVVSSANAETPTAEVVSSATATASNKTGGNTGSTDTESTTSASTTNNSKSPKGGGGGLATGAIAGIAVGAIIGAIIIGAMIWFFLRKRRQNKKLAGGYTATDSGNAYIVDKETHGRTTDSPNSPYSDENGTHNIAIESTARDEPDIAPVERGLPRTSTGGSQGGRSASGAQTPQGVSTNVAHLVEDGMTADEIRRLEEEERQLDDEIERAARR